MSRISTIVSNVSLLLTISFFFTFYTLNTYVRGSELQDVKQAFHVNPSPNYLPTDSKINSVENTGLDEIRKNFASPGTDYATSPLWVWNDLLTEEQIRSTLADLNNQHVNMAFVHPRPGLATPYLTDAWFNLWNTALDEATKRGMKIWIYDENSYPSGFAGGYVPDAFPESRGMGLDVVFLDNLVDSSNNWTAGEAVLYVVEQLKDGSTKDRTQEILDARAANNDVPTKSQDGLRWIVGRVSQAGPSQWFGGKTYVNLMEKGVLDSFIGFTHEAYRQHFGKEFGKLIPGAFTDEPQVASAGMFSWCSDFPQQFQQRRGYDIVSNIGSLLEPVGDWKKVRYDYYKTVLEVFIERWHKPLGEYCESVGLEYTGHDWEHEWPNAHHNPDNMATAFWRQRPAIDLLMNNFSRGTHSQFGNVRSVRELNSVTRQAGRCRSISENYGAGGYDIKFEDLKRLGDWSYALGVNTTDEHLSYVTIRGARKHDHPQTFSYHSPWFEQYSKLEDYWTRLSYVLSRGELSRERFLLLEPTSTVWLYQANAGQENNGKKDIIGNEFAELLNKLEAAQIDYDLGSEDIIERAGSVAQGRFVVGAASYQTVVLPGSIENLDVRTLELLLSFIKQGGKVVSLNAPLNLISGVEISKLSAKLQNSVNNVKSVWKVETLDELIASEQVCQKLLVQPSSNMENIFHQTRETQDALILFVCNIDLDNQAEGKIVLNELGKDFSSVEILNPLSGKIDAYGSIIEDKAFPFSLQPCNSLLLVFSKEKAKESKAFADVQPTILDPWKLADDLVDVVPCDDNVLVLDYMTVKMQNASVENEYFYRANSWFWKQKGYPMSPWDNGVQFKDELITKKFQDESGFELDYKFNKSDAQIDNLRFVVENPDMFQVYCNDQKVTRLPCWKFDRSFGVFDISKVAKPGENILKLVAEKSTIFCELMPAWIVGSFSLESADMGYTIVADKGLSFIPKNDSEKVLPIASNALEGVSWLSSGIGFSPTDDRSPQLSFKFSNDVTLSSMRIWNYCESNLTKRGIKTFEIKVFKEDGTERSITDAQEVYELKIGDGHAQTINLPKDLSVAKNETLVIRIKSNWNGISYPVADHFIGNTKPDVDNAFVGLAEIQFLDEESNLVIPSISASSELKFRSHDRRAIFAIDGSGLDIPQCGWASQGRPFYAGAVDYRFNLDLSALSADKKPILFELPHRTCWNGAVAVILINDEQIGSIGWQGESVDLSSSIERAIANKDTSLTLTVRVYGTPKNLFGPHHAGKLRGSAWPGSFHGAPQTQPAGSSYDVIEYGLFAD